MGDGRQLHPLLPMGIKLDLAKSGRVTGVWEPELRGRVDSLLAPTAFDKRTKVDVDEGERREDKAAARALVRCGCRLNAVRPPPPLQTIDAPRGP